MYGTCIFCNASLGTNEVLERFPVGRRIAYDERTGRLWAVCRACERWNLSPIETRWEAIEEAERVFRATPLKVSGENIGLAQTTEGLELVRIGTPPKVELAAWRYGDQFGRRRRRHLMVGSVGAVGVAGSLAYAAFGIAGLTAGVIGTGLTATLTGFQLAHGIHTMGRYRKGPARTFIRDDAGKVLRLNLLDARLATLVPLADSWRLDVPHQVQIGKPGVGAVTSGMASLTGVHAHEALSRLLPYLNRDGGSRRHIRDAVGVIDEARSVDGLIRAAAVNTEAKRTHFKVPEGASNVGALPARIRLAMEMALHDADERRAMEGELAALEARWREADAIAKVADALLLPEDLEREMRALRDREER
ncbi:MAG TPA: hypothetical protein VFO55_03825 [Gemmatimonadaceae bacterium]|nr:hypothetical protein [Gemmatimonadaceae bacterium]